MKAALAAGAALLVGAPSEPIKTGPGTAYFTGLPPVRFVKEDITPVIFATPENVTKLCGGDTLPEGFRVLACARKDKRNVKWLILPHPAIAAGEPYADLVTHELGHRAGWSGMHEL